MGNVATKIQKTYQLHLDFEDLTGTLDCLYDGDCKSVINFGATTLTAPTIPSFLKKSFLFISNFCIYKYNSFFLIYIISCKVFPQLRQLRSLRDVVTPPVPPGPDK